MQLRVYLAVVLALVLIMALSWFYFDTKDAQDPTLVSLPLELPVDTPVVHLPPEPNLESSLAPAQIVEEITRPKEQTILPALNESDAYVRAQAAALSSSILWADWVTRDELIRRFIAVIENAARGELPRRQLGFLAPQGNFRVIKRDGKIYLDDRAYERYDALVEIVLSLPVETSAQLISTIQPLLSEALRELGVKKASTPTLLQAAVDQVLATPVVHGEIELKQPKVFYLFADSELESLSSLQKQIIRMGPSNTLRLQTFVRRLVLALEGNML